MSNIKYPLTPFGQIVYDLMEEKKITPRNFAQRTGRDPKYVSNVCRGVSKITIPFVNDVIHVFDIVRGSKDHAKIIDSCISAFDYDLCALFHGAGGVFRSEVTIGGRTIKITIELPNE